MSVLDVHTSLLVERFGINYYSDSCNNPLRRVVVFKDPLGWHERRAEAKEDFEQARALEPQDTTCFWLGGFGVWGLQGFIGFKNEGGAQVSLGLRCWLRGGKGPCPTDLV